MSSRRAYEIWSSIVKLLSRLRRVNKTPLALITLISIPLFALTQNCSQPYNLDVLKYEDQPGAMQATVEINQGKAFTNNRDLNLKFDMLYAREVLISEGGETCRSEGEWKPIESATLYNLSPTEETKTIFVNFRNFNKREISCASASITLDTTAPEVLISESPATISNEKNAKFVIKGSDNLVGLERYECRLNNGEFSNCSDEDDIETGDLNDGNYKFEMRAFDKAGNESKHAVFEWLIDTLAPSLKFSAKPAAFSQLLDTRIAFTVADGAGGSQVTGIKCQLDSGAQTTCTSPMALSSLSQGSHTVKVTLIDNAANEITRSYTWFVDNVPPTFNLLSGPPAITNLDDVKFAWDLKDSNGAGSGVNVLTCSLDGATPVACVTPKNIPNVPDGPHKLTVRAVDKALNEVSKEFSFFVDDTPPQLVEDEAPPRYLNKTSAVFRFSPIDPNGANGSGIDQLRCSKDEAELATCTATKTFSGLVNGSTYTFRYEVLDKATNVAGKNYTVTIDTVKPLLPTFINKPATGPKKTVSFKFSSTDNEGGSGVAGYFCTFDDEEEKACNTGQFSKGALEPGFHRLRVAAVDKAGTRSSVATASWTVTAQ